MNGRSPMVLKCHVRLVTPMFFQFVASEASINKEKKINGIFICVLVTDLLADPLNFFFFRESIVLKKKH